MTLYKCAGLSSTVDDLTTHVIVKTDTSFMAQRTLKYLQVVLLIQSNYNWIRYPPPFFSYKVVREAAKKVLFLEGGGLNGCATKDKRTFFLM